MVQGGPVGDQFDSFKPLVSWVERKNRLRNVMAATSPENPEITARKWLV